MRKYKSSNTEGKRCMFRIIRHKFNEAVKKIKEIDEIMNYGIIEKVTILIN